MDRHQTSTPTRAPSTALPTTGHPSATALTAPPSLPDAAQSCFETRNELDAAVENCMNGDTDAVVETCGKIGN